MFLLYTKLIRSLYSDLEHGCYMHSIPPHYFITFVPVSPHKPVLVHNTKVVCHHINIVHARQLLLKLEMTSVKVFLRNLYVKHSTHQLILHDGSLVTYFPYNGEPNVKLKHVHEIYEINTHRPVKSSGRRENFCHDMHFSFESLEGLYLPKTGHVIQHLVLSWIVCKKLRHPLLMKTLLHKWIFLKIDNKKTEN